MQTVLTRLFEGASFERLPYLAILPRGMANTTAADVGLRGKAAPALARLIAASRDGTLAEHVVERPILRVENLQGGTSQRGMMFGAGAITDIIEFCCREIYERGLHGKLGMSVALAGLLLLKGLRLLAEGETRLVQRGAPGRRERKRHRLAPVLGG